MAIVDEAWDGTSARACNASGHERYHQGTHHQADERADTDDEYVEV